LQNYYKQSAYRGVDRCRITGFATSSDWAWDSEKSALAMRRRVLGPRWWRVTFPAEVVIAADDASHTVVATTTLNQPGSFDLPADRLRPGNAYLWSINNETGAIKGRFAVASLQTQREILKRISKVIEDDSLSETGRAMLFADVFNGQGYAFDRDRELVKLVK
jgi:hypothetical protein